MKKLLAILLAVCMVLSLAACGGDSGSDATNPGGSNTPTQGENGGSKEPTTQNDPHEGDEGDDPDYSEDEDNGDPEEDETTEPSSSVTDLSDVPNPLGLNSLVLAAYLNNCGTYNYSTGEINKREITWDMLNGIRNLSISGDFFDEGSTLTFYTIYVTNMATATSEEDYEYEYADLICELDFVPDFSGDALEVLMSDLKDCELTGITLSNLPISDLSALATFPELTFVSACFCENLTSLAGLENLTKLERLDCYSGYALEDISALANLNNLDYVDLNCNNITDLAPLANLINLETLKLGSNPITDMSPLANLPALESLGLGSTDIAAVPEGGTTAVTYLSFGGYDSDMADITHIAEWLSPEEEVQIDLNFEVLDNLSGIEKIGSIDYLSVQGETITNDDMVYLGTAHIEQLYLSGSAVTDLSAFAGNEYIKEISIRSPELTDISPLATCPNLTSISVNGTAVTDVSCLSGMESLNTLILSLTSVADVSCLVSCPNLVYLDLQGTAVTDVSCLANLPALEELYLGYTDVSDVSALAACPKLEYLSLRNCTNITDISALAASTSLKQIAVDYDAFEDLSAFEGTDISVG